VEFRQTTSAEETWSGKLTDSSGNEVNNWTWFDMAPAAVVWDGRSRDGRLAADGLYTYRLESTDKAGNRGVSVPASVTVDTSTVEASVTASLDVFGPNGNGVRDTVSFFMKSKTNAPVSDWVLTVKDGANREVRSWTGNGTPSESVVWNGRNTAGAVAPDGIYRVALRVNFLKGDVAEAITGDVLVDTQPPVIKLGVASGLFSPDKDGLKDSLSITQSSSREDLFEASFVTSQGRRVAGFRWTGELKPFEWNGTDDSGNRLPDGDYSYVVVGTDKAGNQTTSTLRDIRIDTAPTPVYLTANQGYVRAGETDPAKYQTFTAVVPNAAGVAGWAFSIVGEDRKAVYTKTGSRTVPGSFTWNGTDDKGRPVEGPFIGVLIVSYDKGSQPRGESRPFISDGSPPEVTVQVSPQPFSPDGDNVDDEAVIGLAVEDRSRITEWSLEIFDPRGKGFITFSGKGRPSERIIWDGRSGRGELVESAEDYPYVLTVTDVLGHTAVKKGEIAVDVLVLRDGNRLKILINNITFQPNLPQLTLTGDEGAKNVQVLDRLAQIMQKYGSYRIVVEGHAVSLNWANAVAAEREERDILIPLSKSRAQTVVNELASRGIASGRLTAVGKGGSEPIVPHGDVEERWRNRRVEFFLEK
jgi:outer membrane protein OmpA-like peptidoglycan-associated protein/flagellar hook assembly protein FlgD